MVNGKLGAEINLADYPLPGERYYNREYKPSKVLGGATYESSQYILRWYRNYLGSVGPPGVYTYSKGNMGHLGDFIIARMHQSLSIRVGKNGPYPEASGREYSAYKEIVKDTMLATVSIVCSKLKNASYVNGICILSEE